MNLQENVIRVRKLMGLNESQYLGSCVQVGDKNSFCLINDIFSDATEMAYYVGNPDEEDYGQSEKITRKDFFDNINRSEVKKKFLKGDAQFFYIPNLSIYYIYNSDQDVHYFYK